MNKYYIWLSSAMGEANPKTYVLLEYFERPEAVWAADFEELKCFGLAKSQLERLMMKNMSGVHAILKECAEKEYGVVTLEDELYPERLRQIVNPPLVLYYRGDFSCIGDNITIAIVGTRAASAYGLQCSEKIAGSLAKTGFLVVSGMADGIDCAANIGAIKGGGKTVAVLGNGVDRAYPSRNEALMHKIIADSGVVISEFAPGSPIQKYNFPIRNRIMSGLAYGVLVVEAPERSGALITARLALEQDRDLFVVPGNINSQQSRGTLNLLKENCAKPVTEALDIIREYIDVYPHKIKHIESLPQKRTERPTPRLVEKNHSLPQERRPLRVANGSEAYVQAKERQSTMKQELALSPEEQMMRTLIEKGAVTTDELIARSGLTAGKVAVCLTMLETKGYIKALPGARYQSNFQV